MSQSNVTKEQEDKLNMFVGMTSAELDVAKKFMEACSWNTQVAIDRFYTLDGDASKLAPPSSAASSSTNNINMNQAASQPQASSLISSLFGGMGGMGGMGGGMGGGMSADDRQIQQLLAQQQHGLNRQYVPSNNNTNANGTGFDPQTGVRAADNAFYEQMLPSNFDAMGGHSSVVQRQDSMKDFSKEWQQGSQGKRSTKQDQLSTMFSEPRYRYMGSFDNAKEFGAQKNAWILVNIQSTDNFVSHCLNRDLWNDKDFSETIKSCFILYQHTNQQTKGQQFMNLYHVFKVPCLVVVDPNTGREEHKFNIPDQPNKLSKVRDEIIDFLDKHPNPKSKPKKVIPKAPSSKSQVPISNDDAALQAALAASLAEAKESESNNVQSSENTNNNDDIAITKTKSNNNNNDVDMGGDDWDVSNDNEDDDFEKEMTKDKENEKDKVVYELDPEPAAMDKDATALRVRMPNGSLLQRRFKKSAKVQQIYTWIYLTEGNENFSMFQPMPRMNLDGSKEKTLQELGLLRATLVCSFND